MKTAFLAMSLIVGCPSLASAEQIILVCSGETSSRGGFAPGAHTKTWDNEVLNLDLDARVVTHGTETDTTPIVKITSTAIEWRDDDGSIKIQGGFSRVNLTAREVLLFAHGGTITNYYQDCRRVKPRL